MDYDIEYQMSDKPVVAFYRFNDSDRKLVL